MRHPTRCLRCTRVDCVASPCLPLVFPLSSPCFNCMSFFLSHPQVTWNDAKHLPERLKAKPKKRRKKGKKKKKKGVKKMTKGKKGKKVKKEKKGKKGKTTAKTKKKDAPVAAPKQEL